MSQVKNLRAMFEQNNNDTSPPEKGSDRGRSPTGASDTPTPRPLSRVRTNFIAIEKDGRVGLRRDPSTESGRSLSQRRLSVNTEEGSTSALSERTNMASVHEAIPESPRKPNVKATLKTNGSGDLKGPAASAKLGAVSDKPSHNPDKHVDLETPTPKLLPADPTLKPAPAQQPLNDTSASGGTPTTRAAKTTTAKGPASKLATKQLGKLQTGSPKTTNTTAASSKSLATKSPSLPKTPTSTTPVTSRTAKATKEPAKKTTTTLPRATKTTSTTTSATTKSTKPNTATAAATTAPAKSTVAPVKLPSSSSTGFIKPKVKSPTRPVTLPSSLTAPTAASASHTKVKDGPRDSLSSHVASGTGSGTGIGRSLSRASVSTVATSVATKTVRRQRSTINQPRPSLGPPPKKSAQDHPVIKRERVIDEDFLARMMRPTKSSSSKVTEKAPVTPPRRGLIRKEASSARPSTSTSAKGRRVNQSAAAGSGATGSPSPKATRDAALEGVHSETAQDNSQDALEVEEALREATRAPPAEPVPEEAPAAEPHPTKAQPEIEAEPATEEQPEVHAEETDASSVTEDTGAAANEESTQPNGPGIEAISEETPIDKDPLESSDTEQVKKTEEGKEDQLGDINSEDNAESQEPGPAGGNTIEEEEIREEETKDEVVSDNRVPSGTDQDRALTPLPNPSGPVAPETEADVEASSPVVGLEGEAKGEDTFEVLKENGPESLREAAIVGTEDREQRNEADDKTE